MRRKSNRPIVPSEHVEAKALMQAAQMEWWGENIFHIPNGGQRNKIIAAKLKAEGTMRGVADYLLMIPAYEYHGLFVELKSLTGRQSDEQKEFEQRAIKNCYCYIVANGWEAALQGIRDYLTNKVHESRRYGPGGRINKLQVRIK